jgi:hypothetical protein
MKALIYLWIHRLMDFSKRCPVLKASLQLTPIILATQEAEIRRIVVQSQTWQIVRKTLSKKIPSQKRAGKAAQGVGRPRVQTPVPQKKKKAGGGGSRGK